MLSTEKQKLIVRQILSLDISLIVYNEKLYNIQYPNNYVRLISVIVLYDCILFIIYYVLKTKYAYVT